MIHRVSSRIDLRTKHLNIMADVLMVRVLFPERLSTMIVLSTLPYQYVQYHIFSVQEICNHFCYCISILCVCFALFITYNCIMRNKYDDTFSSRNTQLEP